MSVGIAPAIDWDIGPIAWGMRDMDRLECAAFGHTAAQALSLGLAHSYTAYTVIADGTPIAMFGVTPESLYGRIGTPWLLATTDADRHARAFLELPRPFIAEIRVVFPRLRNFVHAENRKAIRWLTWLGFEVEAELTDIGGQPMRRFSLGFSREAPPSATPSASP